MTVSDAIDQLAENGVDQELIIAWWDKETVEINTDTILTDEEWLDLIEHADYKMSWSSVNDTFMDIIEDMRSNT